MLLFMIVIMTAGSAQEKVNYGSNHGKYLTVYNSRIYYEEYGKGTPLLLFHGGLSSIKGFSNVIPALSRHFRVIAIDAPGNGRSEQADSVSFKLMADYYSRMIDLLGLDSVYVYGYSMGGITALHLAADRPDKVKRVVAHSAVNNLQGYNEGFAGTPDMTPEIVEQHAKWWVDGHLKRTPQPGKWKKYILDLQKIWYPEEFIPDTKLKSIQCPFLVLQGDKDLVRIENALHIHQQIPGSSLCILPNTTHFSLEENPELVLNIIMPYLQKKANKTYELGY